MKEDFWRDDDLWFKKIFSYKLLNENTIQNLYSAKNLKNSLCLKQQWREIFASQTNYLFFLDYKLFSLRPAKI